MINTLKNIYFCRNLAHYMKPLDKQIIRLAIPNTISNITIPLVGVIALFMAGHIGQDGMIGGLAIGGTIFSFLYWPFSFLRMGTGGFTAQAYGARNFHFASQTLLRALTVSSMIGVGLIIFQAPVFKIVMSVMSGSDMVHQYAAQYFFTRIWAAPATLSLYAFTGWFIGMQNSRTPMWIALLIIGVNTILSYIFAFIFDMGVSGIALGTVVAQWSGVAMAIIVIRTKYWRFFRNFNKSGLYKVSELGRFFKVNSDIFIRTICLVLVYAYFTIASTQMGDQVLAANTLTLQLYTVFSYMMDGFGYAGESLVGKFYGAGNSVMKRRTVYAIIKWGFATALVVTTIYAIFGQNVLVMFNPSQEVLDSAKQYIGWVIAAPLLSFLAFLIDGFLVGLTASSVMRNGMMISTGLFFLIYFTLSPVMGNNALWLAFMSYLFFRGFLQMYLGRKKLFSI